MLWGAGVGPGRAEGVFIKALSESDNFDIDGGMLAL